MRVASYEIGDERDYGIVLNGKLVRRSALDIKLPENIVDLIAEKALVEALKRDVQKFQKYADPLDKFHLLPPIPSPGKLICLGLNYIDHAEEQGVKPPAEPIIFFKPKTSLTGPYDDIVYPKIVKQLDYEGELVVVIGKRGKNIREEDAMEYVFGYTVMNDVSARDIQFGDKQWTRGKSFDTFAPCGPWIVTKDEVSDPHRLRILTKVNDEVRQNSSTANMVFKIPRIVSSMSMVMTLEPGDMISTGTPAGVGYFMRPKPELLSVGDVVEISIENVGTIRNRVVGER
ncbi:MAG: fumarylacetoacetate hydrolase family protein [Nitrososphaerota archaeon]